MKLFSVSTLIIASAFVSLSVFASGTSKVIDQETIQLEITNPINLDLSCSPGRPAGHGFPTSSALVLRKAGGFFEKSKTDSLVFEDSPNLGNNCSALTSYFLSRLPATLTVTRTVTETCWIDDSGRDTRAHIIDWQSLVGSVGGMAMGSGDEILLDKFVEGGKCTEGAN